MNIVIGTKPLYELTADQLIEIVLIEGAHCVLEMNGQKLWNKPVILDFDNKMFSDTLVIDYQSSRIEDGKLSKIIEFFFNCKDFYFHWNWKDEKIQPRRSNRFSVATIKYLIQNGYNLPLY